MQQAQLEEQRLKELLDQELAVLNQKNLEIFSEDWLVKVLGSLDQKTWPDVKDLTDNVFGQFVATAFKASELVIEVCHDRFKAFQADPGLTQEEMVQRYAQAMALCEYAAFLSRVTYENAQAQLKSCIEVMVKSVTEKEDPNVELN